MSHPKFVWVVSMTKTHLLETTYGTDHYKALKEQPSIFKTYCSQAITPRTLFNPLFLDHCGHPYCLNLFLGHCP